jgi:type III secretion system FlhB-like substrate exporter
MADDRAAAADSYQRPPPRVMICNRGEIARRVIRTANQHGLETVAIYTHVSVLQGQGVSSGVEREEGCLC